MNGREPGAAARRRRLPEPSACSPAAGRPRRIRVANIKSHITRVNPNETRRQRDKSGRSSVRTAVRRFREAVGAGAREKATELQRAAAKALDKAASKGVIHRNQAA